MADTLQISSPEKSAVVLDGKTVLHIAKSLCNVDRINLIQLHKGLSRLVDSRKWSAEIVNLERLGVSAKHCIAPINCQCLCIYRK